MKRIRKLLSRLKVIDYAIIIILIIGLVFFFFFFKRNQKTIYVDVHSFKGEFSENAKPPSYFETDSIHKGDIAYNSFGKMVAEVIEVKKSEWGGNKKYINLVIKLKVLYDTRTKKYTFSDMPILIGNQLSLNFPQTIFYGEIINFYTDLKDRFSKYKIKKAEVTLNLRGLETWQAESMKDFEAKNSMGEIIAKTTKIEIKPAEMEISDDQGNVFLRYSPIKKDVRVTLLLYGLLCSEQICYFNESQPIKIGEDLFIHSDKTSIQSGNIVSFNVLDNN